MSDSLPLPLPPPFPFPRPWPSLTHIHTNKNSGNLGQLVERSPSMSKALASFPSATETGCAAAFLQSQHSEAEPGRPEVEEHPRLDDHLRQAWATYPVSK